MTFFCSTKTYIEIWVLLTKVDSLHVDCIALMNLQHLPIFFTLVLCSKFQIPLHRTGLSTSSLCLCPHGIGGGHCHRTWRRRRLESCRWRRRLRRRTRNPYDPPYDTTSCWTLWEPTNILMVRILNS
jgi:hypothetical protein